MTYNEEFDARDVRRLREALGVTTEVLARFIGVGPNALRCWQKMNDRRPSGLALTLLNAIALAFKRDPVNTVLAVNDHMHHGVCLLRVLKLAYPEETDIVTVETTDGPVRIDLAKLKGFEVKSP